MKRRARKLRRDPSLFRQPPQELAAREIPPTGARVWSGDAGALVLRPEDPPLAEAVRIDDLYELACWLAKASLFVGNDSGITHLAAAVGTPVLALVRANRPGSLGAARARRANRKVLAAPAQKINLC